MTQKAKQRSAAAGREGGGSGRREPAAHSEEGLVLHIGRIRVHLGRIPELLLLIAFAYYVAQLCTEHLDVTFPAAIPMGLFAARQMQKLLAWLGSNGAED
mmetsp:Transcript_12283/g.24975  ORF Transcript_12283/g.24975 Transcript_12283/m.24975 type:complete len:100 (+) Transcript_12283:49-348(+)